MSIWRAPPFAPSGARETKRGTHLTLPTLLLSDQAGSAPIHQQIQPGRHSKQRPDHLDMVSIRLRPVPERNAKGMPHAAGEPDNPASGFASERWQRLAHQPSGNHS